MFFTDYALSDFLMFSPASYYRRYELVNAELWPGQLLLAAIALTVLWALFYPGPRLKPWTALALATTWVLVALLFLHRHYAQINLIADWFAVAFLAQALVFLGCHFSQSWRESLFSLGAVTWKNPGFLLALYAMVVHPLLGPLSGRSWQGIELFGVSPNVTALATIGILLTGALRKNWVLLLLPFVWCLFSALTYLAMEQYLGLMPLLLAVIALVATILNRHLRPQTRIS